MLIIVTNVAEKKIVFKLNLSYKIRITTLRKRQKTQHESVERAKNKLTETPEEKAIRLQKRNTRQRREQKKISLAFSNIFTFVIHVCKCYYIVLAELFLCRSCKAASELLTSAALR